jgi:ubiquinone/menaquinone biosynthesis C-methylase UbiE
VLATDLSERQIEYAQQRENIVYSVSKAETTSFQDNSFDLITIAQAVHWVNVNAFYSDVIRVAKPNAPIAIWGYSLFSVHPEMDRLIADFYTNIIGSYWDKERKLIDQKYRTIPFPFREIASPKFEMAFEWTLAELEGYLNTWSAVQKFVKANNFNPVSTLIKAIYPLWNQSRFVIRFPLFVRLGIIEK